MPLGHHCSVCRCDLRAVERVERYRQNGSQDVECGSKVRYILVVPAVSERETESPRGQTADRQTRTRRKRTGQGHNATQRHRKKRSTTQTYFGISRVTHHTRNLVEARVGDPLRASRSGHTRRRRSGGCTSKRAARDVVGCEGVEHVCISDHRGKAQVRGQVCRAGACGEDI